MADEENGGDGDDAVACSLARIENKLDAMTNKVNDLNTTMTGIDARLTSVESKMEQMDNLIVDKVRSEIDEVSEQ